MSESNRAQEMIQYLLATLPEKEMERLDVLSIADEDFADELNAAEKNLVDAYVQGELRGAMLERFESHYLASPLRRGQVEFARTFHDFAERSWAKEAPDVALAPAWPERPTAGLWSALSTLHQSLFLRWGLAAVAVILLAAGVWWTLQSRSSGVRQQLVASFVLAPPLRGSDHLPTFSIPAGSAVAEVQIELESDDYAGYRVALADESGGADLWHSGTLKATGTGGNHRLGVRFPAQLVKSKIYSLVVSGIRPAGEAEIIGNYPFRAQMD